MTTQRHTAERLVAGFDFALVLTLSAGLLAWFFDPFKVDNTFIHVQISWGFKPLAAALILIAVRVVLSRRVTTSLFRPRLLPRLALSLGITLLTLAGIEAMLAKLGVPPGEPVFVVKGQSGDAIRADGSMISDSDLLWRFQPGTVFNGRTVNRLGFLDRDVDAAKPAGTKRIICMGDSCSAQGVPTYAGYIHQLLQESTQTNGSWEALNTAVHGYTVLQGVAQYRKTVAALSPDVVTVFYGWNDHWLAGETDEARLSRVGSPWITACRNALVRKRLVTVLSRLRREENTAGQKVIRVPLETYERGLGELIRAIQADGAVPVVITAPRAATITGHLVNAGHTSSVEDALRLHDEYTEITRQVALTTGAQVIDLATLFDRPDLFSDDGIHYTQEGIQHVAELLHRELAAFGIIPTSVPGLDH